METEVTATQFLSSNLLFSSLGPDEIAAIVKKLQVRHFASGEVIFCQGDTSNSLFLVDRGSVRMEAEQGGSAPVVINTMEAGAFFGELSLLDGQGRSATAVVEAPATLYELTREDFFELVRGYHAIALHLMRVMAERLRFSTRNLCDAMQMLKQEPGWNVQASGELLPALPLVTALCRSIGAPAGNLTAFIGLQHLMGSTATLVEAITGDRIKPGATFLLGKPYSTCVAVMHALAAKGIYVHPDSSLQSVPVPHDEALHHRIDALLEVCVRRHREAVSGAPPRILLIDDGGHAIEALHTNVAYRELLPFVTSVEQTRSGIRRVEKLELRVPVINVAESWVKLEYESPMIAESVKIELFRELVAIESGGIPIGRRVLVIGYGSVGRWVAARLRGCGFQVGIYDTSPVYSQLALIDGFQLEQDYHAALSEAELIIGCTGTPVMDDAEYQCLRDGAILISTSSSDIEFRAWKLRQRSVSLGRPRSWSHSGLLLNRQPDAGSLLWQGGNHPCFDLYKVALGDRHVYLVKGGFPVNFTGEADPIPPQLIQLTRALLYAGGVQASHTTSPGIHALRDDYQELIVDLFQQSTPS